MAASPAISMYRLPTYYEDMAVPLPKCMYSLPSYFQTNSEMEVGRLVLIVCQLQKEFSLHVYFPEAGFHCCSHAHKNFIRLFQGVQSQESSSSIQTLKSRQEDILCELNGLKAAVEEMASRLGVSLPRQKPKVRSQEPLSLTLSLFSKVLLAFQ